MTVMHKIWCPYGTNKCIGRKSFHTYVRTCLRTHVLYISGPTYRTLGSSLLVRTHRKSSRPRGRARNRNGQSHRSGGAWGHMKENAGPIRGVAQDAIVKNIPAALGLWADWLILHSWWCTYNYTYILTRSHQGTATCNNILIPIFESSTKDSNTPAW